MFRNLSQAWLEISFQLLHLHLVLVLVLSLGLLGMQVLAYPWQMQALRRTRGAYVTQQQRSATCRRQEANKAMCAEINRSH